MLWRLFASVFWVYASTKHAYLFFCHFLKFCSKIMCFLFTFYYQMRYNSLYYNKIFIIKSFVIQIYLKFHFAYKLFIKLLSDNIHNNNINRAEISIFLQEKLVKQVRWGIDIVVRKNAKILIEQALLELLIEQPLDHIDVQDVAQKAGLSRQTFYYNFKNKHDLLCWILEQDIAMATEAFRAGGEMYDYIKAALNMMKEKAVFYRSIAASEQRRRSYINYFENGLLDCAKIVENRSTLGRMSTQLWDSLQFFTYGASGMMQNWVENGMQQTPAQVAEVIICNMPITVARYFQNSMDKISAK